MHFIYCIYQIKLLSTFKLPIRAKHSFIYRTDPMWKFKCKCIVDKISPVTGSEGP